MMKTCCNDGKRMTPYSEYVSMTPALPSFYWDVYSSEQRIKDMCKELCKLAEYGTYLAESIDRIQSVSPEDFQAYQQDMRSVIADLRKEIYELSVGTMAWNVQHGRFTSSTQAQRDMFNDLTVHAITINKLNSLEMTVSDLANCGLNVRGLAVMSYWLVMQFDIPEDFKFTAYSGDTQPLTTNQLNIAEVNKSTGAVYIPKEFRSV